MGSEQDINLVILQKVKNYPEIYRNTGNLPKRRLIWSKIASSLDMPVPYVMSRWHYLMDHYEKMIDNGKRSKVEQNFKYKKEMNFYLPYVKPSKDQKQLEARPKVSKEKENYIDNSYEFVVNEADLEDISSDESEFNYIDINEPTDEDMSPAKKPKNSSGTIQILSLVGDSTTDSVVPYEGESQSFILEESLIQVDDDDEEHHHTLVMETEEEQDKSLQNAENIPITSHIIISDERNQTIIQPIEVFKEEEEKLLEEKSSPEEELKPNETKNQEEASSSCDSVSNTPKTGKEPERVFQQKESRCEDEIFGELVAVMLKTMPSEKKRSVKKEIMNILL